MSDLITLVEPMIPALRRYARALLRDHTAADDLVQDCLERTVAHWHRRRADGDPRTWVFTILHNLAINRLRQKARRGQHLDLADADPSALAVPPMQEDRLRHADLLAALNALPADQRAVLLLVSVEGLAYAEAAGVLDIPIGTVMSRLARARDRMRLLMAGDATTLSRASHLRSVK